MKKITITVEENNFQPFMDFVNTLDYEKVLESNLSSSEIRNEWVRNF